VHGLAQKILVIEDALDGQRDSAQTPGPLLMLDFELPMRYVCSDSCYEECVRQPGRNRRYARAEAVIE
jgi:hypothetical protein